MGARVARGHRRARLPPLARAAALELHRHAHGLVASGHQLGLSVSHLKWVGGAASAVTRRAPSATPRGRSALARAGRGEPAPRPAGRRSTSAPARPGAASRSPSWSIFVGIVLILWGAFKGSDGARFVAAGLVIASLGGGELALREHLAGYRSHSSLLAGVAAFVVVTVVALGLGPVQVWLLVLLGVGRLRRYFLRDARALQAPLRRARLPVTGRRLRIAGLHHVTLLCKDVERSVDFYRNLLGMRLVEQTVNERRPAARATCSSATRRVGPARSSPASSTPTSTRARSAADRPTTSRSRSRARRSWAAGATT